MWHNKVIKKKIKILFCIVILIMLGCGWRPAKIPSTPTVNVSTDRVTTRAVPIIVEAPATVEAETSVAISPQVAGIIKKIYLKPGEQVYPGQLLVELESQGFVQNLAEAKANLQRDLATLAQHKINAKRLQTLESLSDVSKQDAEQAKTLELAQQAAVAASQAKVDLAEVQLGYTKIFAPIAGKAGDIFVKKGDYIASNNTQPLLIINQVEHLLVSFSLPQRELQRVLKNQQSHKLRAEIHPENFDEVITRGELVFIDNKIEQNTGVILLKILVSNRDYKLWPGMCVRAKLQLATEQKALIIPTSAVQLDEKGNFVYCVENSKAKIKRVVVARQYENISVIHDGLQLGEQVIISFPPNLKVGVIVKEGGT